jgi:hypothetical protein
MIKDNLYARFTFFRRRESFGNLFLFLLITSRANIIMASVANAANRHWVSTSSSRSEYSRLFPGHTISFYSNMSTNFREAGRDFRMEELASSLEPRSVRGFSARNSALQALFFDRCRGGTESPVLPQSLDKSHSHAAQRQQQHKYQNDMILRLIEGLAHDLSFHGPFCN